jgi:hypothetical protein
LLELEPRRTHDAGLNSVSMKTPSTFSRWLALKLPNSSLCLANSTLVIGGA